MSKRIQEYEDQHRIVLKELGVLCAKKSKQTNELSFFTNLHDFVQMGLTIYPDESPEHRDFMAVNTLLQDFYSKKTRDFEQADDSTKALLLQVSMSAWAWTKSTKTIYDAAIDTEKKTRQKTRKQKR